LIVDATAAGPGDILQAEPVSFMCRLLGVIEKATDGTAKQCDEKSEYDQHESFLFQSLQATGDAVPHSTVRAASPNSINSYLIERPDLSPNTGDDDLPQCASAVKPAQLR